MTRIKTSLHEDQYTLLFMCRSFLTVKNVSDKSCKANRNTPFLFIIFLNAITWKNIVDSDRPKMTIWCMRSSCWEHPFRICNTYGFITGAMAARTGNVTFVLYVHCLSCFVLIRLSSCRCINLEMLNIIWL